MQVSFSANDIHELFAEWNASTDQASSQNLNEQVIQFPDRICDGWMQRLRLCPGLEMVIQNCQFHDPLALEIQETGNISLLRLGFGIRGQTHGVVAEQGQEIQFRTGHFCVGFASHADRGTIEYARGQQTLLATYIDLEMLNTLIGSQLEHLPRELWQILDGQFLPLYLQTGAMPAAMKLAAQQVLHCPYQGWTKQLYLESKAIELLALSFDQLTDTSSPASAKNMLKPTELERIHQASQILLSNLEQPPSLLQLARLVGLNDYKLKVGFRQVFGTTVFGYLYQ
ncbi:AraC family transcriptional regulator [Leptolyngbya sp. 7M]|uniref:AraC family transcriptional regulator n=1 Tax=Leptolyngbya sp. 7M TaxID=2812896 RepID=UPI001B8B3013|nr:AraC family transcriptional regulator [Leptolyngbya sp. 7M]QYO64242.1 AraC family transcriptional regulator [Leptolyngbya sp. 7M]